MTEPSDDLFIRNAIAWGMSRLGSTDYPGRCLAFVEDCYEKANGIEIFGGSTARESAELYRAAPHPGIPPAGAFVFYDCSGLLLGENKNWGHVGLSLGDGTLLHAWGVVRVDPLEKMEALVPPDGWTSLTYVGWAPSGRVLQGFRLKNAPAPAPEPG